MYSHLCLSDCMCSCVKSCLDISEFELSLLATLKEQENGGHDMIVSHGTITWLLNTAL